MSAEPSRTFSHNTLWRRLRRRYFFDGFSLLGPLFYCPPAICCVSWLGHGPLWLTVSGGVLWALMNVFTTMMMTFSLTLLWHRSVPPRQYPVPTRLAIAWPLFIVGGTLVTLLMGRVDWAFYLSFGLSPLGGLAKIRPLTLSKVLSLILAVGLCLAFAKHAIGILIALLLCEFLRSMCTRPTLREDERLVLGRRELLGMCTRPTLREALARRSTRAEYVARIRDTSGGGKRNSESLLRAECETEQWEEALMELKRRRQGQEFRQNAIVWKAKINLGLGRYEEVLKLEAKARRAGCDIAPYLAVAHARSGQREEAFRIAEEAQRLKRPGAAMALGHVYFADKQYESALQWYEAAAQNRMQRAEALRAAGRTLIALGDYREARSVYDRAIRLTQFVHPEDLLQLAKCLQETHQANSAADMELLAHEKA